MTWLALDRIRHLVISTHTSLVGCDRRTPDHIRHWWNFYSHIPCGMWLNFSSFKLAMIRFLLTHPLWDVTVINVKGTLKYSFLLTHPLWDVTQTRKTVAFCIPISTHTSLVGCDVKSSSFLWAAFNFYSHIPCGMWLLYIVYYSLSIPIYHEMDL